VAATHLVPPANATVEGNTALMGRALDEAGARKTDLVVLSENFVDRGVRQPLGETAQPIPGPATAMLSRKARQHSTYVVTSLHEREGDLIFNTAVLIDRTGRIAGKYRKTHLAMIEGENGVTPGNEYRVIPTDFGKLGLLVCWDNWFAEPPRILRLLGAEVVALPIAGDGDPRHWDIISRARAMDNGVYLVSSNTVGPSPSRIIDPQGEVLAETAEPFGIVVAEIDLDRERRLNWLSVGPGDGEARSLYIRERRPDTYAPLTGDGRR
jgi:predicted amidohydrolase